MVRIFPYAAVQFTSYEFYKSLFAKTFNHHQFSSNFLAGSAAGITAVLLTYPLDTIRARLAFQVTGEHVYTGITHAAVTMFKEVSYSLIASAAYHLDEFWLVLGGWNESIIQRIHSNSNWHDPICWLLILLF